MKSLRHTMLLMIAVSPQRANECATVPRWSAHAIYQKFQDLNGRNSYRSWEPFG